ncbi:MAG: T9SS type A sorting domain-containing protein [Saprospiraceae bacterium]|nr:T9SS type A sorting domain-containing protein [Saprospiraceae bacterium]
MMCKAKCIVSYQLIDASGKLMDKGIYREDAEGKSQYKLRMDSYPTGLYHLQLSSNGENLYSGKIIKN